MLPNFKQVRLSYWKLLTIFQPPLYRRLHGLVLAVWHYSEPEPIDILIGMYESGSFLLSRLRKGEQGTPMAQNAVFRWVQFGTANSLQIPPMTMSTLRSDILLTQLIKKFWEFDELSTRKFFSPKESLCEKLYADLHRMIASSYVYDWRKIYIGESIAAAIRALLRTEKRCR